jgi:autotransporter-associated beta strand protein
MIVTLVLASITTAVCAADRTWDGGGSDAKWSTVNNWDGDAIAPGADDALYFGGTQRLANTNDLPLTDPSFAGLTFNSGAGAFVLWGSRITLGGNVTNWSASTQTLNLPVVLSGTRDFSATNSTITVNSTLSGSGGLTKFGFQWMNLNASNSYDGVTTVSNGTLAVYHSNALGSTNGNTVIQGIMGGYLYLGSGLTIAEPLVLNGEYNNGGTLRSSGGSNILSGPITCYNQVRLQITGGTLIVSGGVTQPDGAIGGLFVVNSSGAIVFNTKPLSLGVKTFHADSGGLTVVGVAGNSWGETLVANGTIRTDVPNALPSTTFLRVGVSGYGNFSGVLDLNGNNQTISKLYLGTTIPGARGIVSATPAILTVNQSADTTYDGSFTGAAGLCKDGSGKLTFTNAATTTTGNFIVSNGTLVVTAASSLGNSTNILVAGGTLELQNGTALSDNATVSISGSGKLKIGTGLTETVSRLFLNGSQGLKGTYGMSGSGATFTNDAFFSSSGLLNVLVNPPIIPTNYVWDATGADTYLSTAANWTNDVLPDLSAGTSVVLFGSGGSTATVNTNANLYGMAFNRDANFTVANGDGALALGLGGVFAAAPTATARAYTLAEDVTLIANQTWTVTNSLGGTTLTASGVIGDGTNTFGFTKNGNGTVVLAGSNTFDGVVTNWCGGIQINHSNALGSAAGGTVINTAGASSSWLSFYGGITLAEPLTFIGGSSTGGCLNNNGGTNTVSGLITTTGGRFVAAGGTVFNITGGMLAPTAPQVVINASGTINITTTPFNLGNGVFWTDASGLTVLGVSGNTWGTTMLTGGSMRMDAVNALPTNSALRVGGIWYGPSCTLNLNGFDQTVATLERAEPTPGTIVITSATPATLTVNQSATTGWDGKFTGAVSLLKLGSGTLTITNASTSTAGSFIVSNGTLVVARDGTLGNNSTNIVVGGTGTLALSNSFTIANSATVKLPAIGTATAKITLAAGVNETIGWLYYGGKMRSVGTYGSTGSAAVYKDDTHFSGTGVLTVLHDKSGLMLMMR